MDQHMRLLLKPLTLRVSLMILRLLWQRLHQLMTIRPLRANFLARQGIRERYNYS